MKDIASKFCLVGFPIRDSNVGSWHMNLTASGHEGRIVVVKEAGK
jgi:hypothetical protein